ncbi:MAG: NfeD family protein [Cyanobacteria bacterium P01_F01_bin.150]
MNASMLFPSDGVARVMVAIHPYRGGRIAYQSTFWPAQFVDPSDGDPIPCGSQVQVVGRVGLTQLVKPL